MIINNSEIPNKYNNQKVIPQSITDTVWGIKYDIYKKLRSVPKYKNAENISSTSQIRKRSSKFDKVTDEFIV